MILVGDAGVEDEPPERISSLVYCTKRLHKEERRAPGWDNLNNTLCNPDCKHGSKGLLSLLVALSGRVIGAPGNMHREGGDELGINNCSSHGSHCIQRSKEGVPLLTCLDKGGDPS